jgi:methionyl-tRNA formyltransferase
LTSPLILSRGWSRRCAEVTVEPVRVVFIGNSAGYSEHFLAALAARSADPADPLALVAVVCPQHYASARAKAVFGAKRSIGSVLERAPAQLARLTASRRAGPWDKIQHLSALAGATMLWPRAETDPDVLDAISAVDASVGIVAGLNRIIKEPAFSVYPPLYNIHPSLLPNHRGPDPGFWQLKTGAREGGATLHRIDPGIDTGPIILREPCVIEPWFDADDLNAATIRAGITIMNRFLNGYVDLADRGVEQGKGAYEPRPKPEDRVVTADLTATEVFNLARAVGWRSALLVDVPREDWEQRAPTRVAPRGPDTVEVRLAEPVPFLDDTTGVPGTMTRTASGGVVLTCRSGTVLFRVADAVV